MRSHDNRAPGRRLARLARWLGFDRNPLRRGTDRIEAALRLVLMIMLVTAVPAAAVLAGQQADHMALNQAHAQQAADHLVNAVLLEQAPATGIPDPYTSVQYAPGCWPAGSPRACRPGPAKSSPRREPVREAPCGHGSPPRARSPIPRSITATSPATSASPSSRPASYRGWCCWPRARSRAGRSTAGG